MNDVNVTRAQPQRSLLDRVLRRPGRLSRDAAVDVLCELSEPVRYVVLARQAGYTWTETARLVNLDAEAAYAHIEAVLRTVDAKGVPA
jgi:hypothetical protein